MIKKKKKIKRTPKTNLDKVRRVFSDIEEGNKFWKCKVGDNVIRILPSNREDGNFAYHSILHYGFKVEGQGRAFPCMGVFNKPCPVCRIVSHFDTETDPDIKELIGRLTPSDSYLMNIIDRNSPDEVKIYSAPKTIMREVMQYMNDEEYGDITDSEEGRDVKIKRTGESLSTRYATRVSPKTSGINTDSWEDNMFNLEKEAYREIPTTKKYIGYLMSNFGGVLDINAALGIENDEDEEEDEKPVKKKKLKVKEEEEPEGEDNDLDEEDL